MAEIKPETTWRCMIVDVAFLLIFVLVSGQFVVNILLL